MCTKKVRTTIKSVLIYSFLEFVSEAGPIFEDDGLASAVSEALPVVLALLNATVSVFNRTEVVVKFLENRAGFPDFFDDAEALETYLTSGVRLTPDQGDALINRSKFNATTIVLASVAYFFDTE